MSQAEPVVPSNLPSDRDQFRNILLFAGATALIYLSAPVAYVGLIHAPLAKKFGADAATANLPSVAYFICSAGIVFIGWWIPYVSWLKTNLCTCFALTGLAGLSLAVALLQGVPGFTVLEGVSDVVKLRLTIAHAALIGVTSPAAVALLWEALGRGVSEAWRGRALGLAFGAGPVLAVIGSSLSQLAIKQLDYPWEFIAHFAATGPMYLLAALLASQFVVPMPQKEVISRQRLLLGAVVLALLPVTFYFLWTPFNELSEQVGMKSEQLLSLILGGISLVYILSVFASQRVLLLAAIATMLLYTGNTIVSNLNLYSEYTLQASPETYSGYQNMLRFSFKIFGGFFLGYLLTRTNPKTTMLVSGGFFILCMLYAMSAPGWSYILVFGLLGWGELVGVYAPNYILSASPKRNMRRNLAIMTLLMTPTGTYGLVAGEIAKQVGEQTQNPAFGFQVSFAVTASLMLLGLLLALFFLPARPQPKEDLSGESQLKTA